MSTPISLRVACLVPMGQIHLRETQTTELYGDVVLATASLHLEQTVSMNLLRGIFCAAANQHDDRIQRTTENLRRFSAIWKEGNCFLQEDGGTWKQMGLRKDDWLYLLPESFTSDSMPHILQMLEEKIRELEQAERRQNIKNGQVFIAMPMDEVKEPLLVDIHAAIKHTCEKLGLKAVRVDDVQSNNEITDTIKSLLEESEFVIADLSGNRPNVYWEAGYAQGIGKTPVYIARQDTSLQFNLKDYPVIFFKNTEELKSGLLRRLESIRSAK